MLQQQEIGTKTASWQRTVARAIQKDYEGSMQYLGTARYPNGSTDSLFVIESASTGGKKYAVRLIGIPGEGMKVSCDCEAGQRGDWFCWHEAAAALMSGLVLAPANNDTAGAA